MTVILIISLIALYTELTEYEEIAKARSNSRIGDTKYCVWLSYL